MSPPRDVIFDLTRLATRFSRSTPNGIDRVDLGYAQHFLSENRGGRGALLGPAGLRAVDNRAGRLDCRCHRGSLARSRADRGRRGLRPPCCASRRRTRQLARHTRVTGRPTAQGRPLHRQTASAAAASSDGRPLPGSQSCADSSAGAIYLNVSQFPLWLDWYFRWLDRRPDVKAVFFIHDLLPISHPEFFPPSEARRHDGRLRVLARRSAGVIVASDFTRKRWSGIFATVASPFHRSVCFHCRSRTCLREPGGPSAATP